MEIKKAEIIGLDKISALERDITDDLAIGFSGIYVYPLNHPHTE